MTIIGDDAQAVADDRRWSVSQELSRMVTYRVSVRPAGAVMMFRELPQAPVGNSVLFDVERGRYPVGNGGTLDEALMLYGMEPIEHRRPVLVKPSTLLVMDHREGADGDAVVSAQVFAKTSRSGIGILADMLWATPYQIDSLGPLEDVSDRYLVSFDYQGAMSCGLDRILMPRSALNRF